MSLVVIPAKAGIQNIQLKWTTRGIYWIPDQVRNDIIHRILYKFLL